MISPKNREEMLGTPSMGKQSHLGICLKTAFRLFGSAFLACLQSLFPEASLTFLQTSFPDHLYAITLSLIFVFVF